MMLGNIYWRKRQKENVEITEEMVHHAVSARTATTNGKMNEHEWLKKG